MEEQGDCPHMFCAVIEEGTIPVRRMRLDAGRWEQILQAPVTVRVDWLQCQVCGQKRSIDKGELLLSDQFIAVLDE